MFCKECGTVLDVHEQCVNCQKKQLMMEMNTEKAVNATSEIVG